MSLDFEKYASKGNEFVHLVRDELGIPKDMAGRIIRSVFHALRNRLSHEESFHLMAQLPMALKGVYVDGWKYTNEFTRINHLDEFLDEIRKEDQGRAGYDFGNNAKAQKAAGAIFKALNYYISEGEINNIIEVLPLELKNFVKESIGGKGEIVF